MISALSRSGTIIGDYASSASRATSLVSLVKKLIAIITLNGILMEKAQAAASMGEKAARCAFTCIPCVGNPIDYARCFAQCMAT